MQVFLNIIYSSTSAVLIAVIGWAFSVSNRVTAVETKVNGQPQKDDDLKQFIKELLDAKFEGLDRRLIRIENNGNGHASH